MAVTMEKAAEFWDALDIQQEWMNPPTLVQKEPQPIWKMTTKEGYLFDDAFWEVFQSFPFKICHVSYSGAPWSLEGGSPEMVVRFTLFDWALRGEDFPTPPSYMDSFSW